MATQTDLESLPIPKKKDDITADWLIKATGLHPIEGTLVINDNIQDGVGFLSNICRVAFKTETGSDESILVKLLPENSEYQSLIDQGFDKIEIQFYSVACPQIIEISPELEANFCKFYGGKYIGNVKEDLDNYASMLILEDLKPSGYVMLNPKSDQWRKNLEKVVKFIAEFNAAGLAIKQFKPEEFEKIKSFCLCEIDGEKKIDPLFDIGLTNSTKLDGLLEKLEFSDESRKSYKELTEKARESLTKTLEKVEESPCLTHGDLWSSNIMVMEDSDSNSTDTKPIKVIDWQLLSYRDSSCDLAPAIFSCIPISQLNKNVVDEFVKIYWKEFMAACERKGVVYEGRNEEEFLEFFNTWGIAFGYYWWIWSIDGFPHYRERLRKAFEVLYEDYDIASFLLQNI